MKKTVFALYLICNVAFGQNMEVTGQMKVKQMVVDNAAQELVVQKTDGTLAKRTVASLMSGSNAVDSVKSFQRDMELLKTLCQCTAFDGNFGISRFIIERLEAHGYTRADMLKMGLSEYQLDAYVPVFDIDGNVYTPIDFNNGSTSSNVIVLKEPLRTTRYLDGTLITSAQTNAEWLAAGTAAIGAFCFPNGSAANVPNYGLLYNAYVFSTANYAKGICPNGYRALFSEPGLNLGSKEIGNLHWDAPNVSSNINNLSFRGAGTRYPDGTFANFRKSGILTHGSGPNSGISSFPNQTYTVPLHGFAGSFPTFNRFIITNSSNIGIGNIQPAAAGGTIRCVRL